MKILILIISFVIAIAIVNKMGKDGKLENYDKSKIFAFIWVICLVVLIIIGGVTGLLGSSSSSNRWDSLTKQEQQSIKQNIEYYNKYKNGK